MTHAGPMPDSAGTFDGWKASERACPKCSEKKVKFRIWESSCGGYEDLNFHCEGCEHRWWVDGCDA